MNKQSIYLTLSRITEPTGRTVNDYLTGAEILGYQTARAWYRQTHNGKLPMHMAMIGLSSFSSPYRVSTLYRLRSKLSDYWFRKAYPGLRQ